jgi:hypothetical protein
LTANSATSTIPKARSGSRIRSERAPTRPEPIPSPDRKTSTTIIALIDSLPPRKSFSARCQSTWLRIDATPRQKERRQDELPGAGVAGRGLEVVAHGDCASLDRVAAAPGSGVRRL